MWLVVLMMMRPMTLCGTKEGNLPMTEFVTLASLRLLVLSLLLFHSHHRRTLSNKARMIVRQMTGSVTRAVG